MSSNLGIKKTHQLMKDRLVDYITSQYFGDNQLLLNSSDELLNREGNLFQKPYIESTPSYLKVINGIKNSEIDSEMKNFFFSCHFLLKSRTGHHHHSAPSSTLPITKKNFSNIIPQLT